MRLSWSWLTDVDSDRELDAGFPFRGEFSHFSVQKAIRNTIDRMATPKRKLIHSGESTQTQGQVMLPVSFSAINTMVRRPEKPTPPEEEEEDIVRLRRER